MIAASASFCRTFQIDPAMVSGRTLSKLGAGEWNMPKLNSLLRAIKSGIEIGAYEIDLARHGQQIRNLIVNARKLDDGDKQRVRLLVAITDVTDARADARQKDDLIRDKAILMQEVQHRVANSLQIIASVLMQSARKVQSEEARGYLHDAHSRVMSIAAVQRQLAASGTRDVSLRTYFIQLCESLGASMIYDRERLSIAVTVDDSVVKSDPSISLGLIVTELVINAVNVLPEQRAGKITVDYRSKGRDWTLSVWDDGVGMPTSHDAPKAGLGTLIIEALAKNLQGEIRVVDGNPGSSGVSSARGKSTISARMCPLLRSLGDSSNTTASWNY